MGNLHHPIGCCFILRIRSEIWHERCRPLHLAKRAVLTRHRMHLIWAFLPLCRPRCILISGRPGFFRAGPEPQRRRDRRCESRPWIVCCLMGQTVHTPGWDREGLSLGPKTWQKATAAPVFNPGSWAVSILGTVATPFEASAKVAGCQAGLPASLWRATSRPGPRRTKSCQASPGPWVLLRHYSNE